MYKDKQGVNPVTKRIITFAIASALFINMPSSFAESVSKADYIHDLVIELNIPLQKSPSTSIDDTVFTALKSGVLKGISFDFKAPITEDEMKIIEYNIELLDLPEVVNEDVELGDEPGSEDDGGWTNEEFESVIDNYYKYANSSNYVENIETAARFKDGLAYMPDLSDDEYGTYHTFEKQGYERISKAMYGMYKAILPTILDTNDSLALVNADLPSGEQGASILFLPKENGSQTGHSLFSHGQFDHYRKTFEGYSYSEGKELKGFEYDSVWTINRLYDSGDIPYEDIKKIMAGEMENPIAIAQGVMPRQANAFKQMALRAYPTEEQGLVFYDYVVSMIKVNNGKPFSGETNIIINIGGIDHHFTKYYSTYIFHYDNPSE